MVVPETNERGNIVGETAVRTQRFLTTFSEGAAASAADTDPTPTTDSGPLSKVPTALILLTAAAVGFLVFGGDV